MKRTLFLFITLVALTAKGAGAAEHLATAVEPSSQAVRSHHWTELIDSSIGAIRACFESFSTRRNDTIRIFDIDLGIKDTTVVFTEDASPDVGYRCTTGAYGGEIHRFERFSRVGETLSDAIFTPVPGEPLENPCYSDEFLSDQNEYSLGWLSINSCN